MVVKPPGQASVWNQYGTLSGNTAGASTFSGTNVVLQGGPNVTLSATGGTVVVSAAAGGTGPVVGGLAALGAGTNTATGGTIVFQNSNGVSFGQDASGNVTGTVRTDYQSAGAYLTTTRSQSLNEIQNPAADAVIFMNTRQLQLQWGSNFTTFTTGVNRQGLFELDFAGNFTDSAANLDAVHIHQSVYDPPMDLVHLEASGTNPLPLRITAAGATGILMNRPVYFNGGSVPMVLGTSQSNSVQYLNANYLQGKASSDFQSTGAYLTTAQPVGAYLTTAQPVGNYAGVNGSIAGGSLTLNTSGATISLPNYLTTAQPVGNYAGTNSGATGCSVTVNTSGVSVNVPTTYLGSNASSGYMLTGERNNYFYTSNNTFANSTHTHGSGPSLTGPVSATSNSGAWSLNVGAIGTGTSQTNVTWTVGTAGLALNASGYAGTVTGATNCSVTANSSGVSVNVGAGGGEATISRWVQPFQMTNAGQLVNGSSVSFVPFMLQAPLACSGVRFAMSINGATTTNNTSGGMTMSASVVLYTRNVSTLSSINSGSFGTSTWATSNATGSMFGARQLSISFANSTLLTPGDYWLALHVSTATAGNTSLAKSISMAIGPDAGQSFLVLPAFGTSAVTTRAALMGLGIHSTGATRGTLAFSDMTGMAGTLATLANLWFELRNYSVY